MGTASDPALRRPTAPDLRPPTSDAILATSFVDVWWVRIPAKLRRYSTLLWAAWSDGTYLTAWPRAAVVLPIALFLFGLAEGATHWTFVTLQSYAPRWGITYVGSGPYATVFAEILPLLVLASFLGPVSANLGLMLATGFAIGDFVFFDPPWFRDQILRRVVVLHVPQLICFVLFLLLSVWPVVATKFLVASAHPRLRSQSDRIQTLVSAAVLAAFVYEWTYFAPMLFRVAWVWQGSASPFTVVLFHNVTMPLLVASTLGGVLVRYWLSHRAEQKALAALRVRVRALVVQAQITPRVGARWLRAILCAAYLTLLIAGFLDSVRVGALIFAGMAAFFLARSYLLRQVWSRWSLVITRYPALLRLGIGVAATWVMTWIVLSLPGMGASKNGIPGQFGAEVLCLLLGFLLMTVLLPNGVLTLQENTGAGNDVRLPVSQVAVQAGTFVALMLLVSKRALAQGICADPSCCFQGNNGAAAGAVAAGLPSAARAGAAPGQKPGPCDSIRAKVKRLAHQLQQVTKAEQDYKQQIDGEISRLQSDMSSLQDQMNDVQNAIQQTQDQLDEKEQEHDVYAKQARGYTHGISQQSGGAGAAIGLDTYLTILDKEIEQLESQLAQQKTQLTQLQQQYAGDQQQVDYDQTEEQQTIEGFEQQIGALRHDYELAKKQLAACERSHASDGTSSEGSSGTPRQV